MFKKLLSILSVFALTFSLVGCSFFEDDSKPSGGTGNTKTTIKIKTPDDFQESEGLIRYFTVEDYKMITEKFPQVDRVMLGRGILRNPGIITQIKNGKNIDKEKLKSFHDRLYNDYKRVLSGDKHVLFKMKELWFYMGNMFQDSDKYIKKIRKSQDLVDYNIIVASIFRELELI